LKLVIILSLVCTFPMSALAASGAGAINMSVNTSARANGMGNAGVAVAWDQDTNHWANSGLLAFRPGIHYRSFEAELAEGLAEDIRLTNKELTLGAYGVTLLFAKGPLPGNYLDMGTHEGTDENNQSTGSFDAYMESQSWGLAMDGVQVLERVLSRDPGTWSRYIGIAGGVTWHEFQDQLAPDNSLQDSQGAGSADGSAKSMGYVLRLTYGDLSRGEGILSNGFLGLNVAGAYGASVLNKSDDFIVHVDTDQISPFPRAYLSGWSYNVQISFADKFRSEMNDIGFGILGDVFNPLISYTRAEDLNEPGYIWNGSGYEYEHDTSGAQEEKSRGWELGLANVFFIRGGHFFAGYGGIDAKTDGGGWKIQAGRLGGFRRDWADVPQATGLPDTHRTTWSMWVDPLAIRDTFFK